MPKSSNECYTYFRISGDFEPDEVTRRLELQPYETSLRRVDRREGTVTPAEWCFGRCDAYSPYVEEQMRQTIAPLRDKVAILNQLRLEFIADLWLEIVPTLHPGESTPCLAPPLDVIDFCQATRTQIDIDLYIEGD